jgi:hypothetical protein
MDLGKIKDGQPSQRRERKKKRERGLGDVQGVDVSYFGGAQGLVR